MMDLGSCSKCQKSIPPAAREQLAGLCLECLRRFLWEKDEETVPAGGGPTSPPDEILPLEIGSTFQGLKVLELVARGGMGVVYKARQPDLDRIVALKVLSPELAKDPEFAQRFNGEAKVLALLTHPNIVQVFDFGRASELYYLVMEYVEGKSLRQLLRKGPIPGDRTVRIVSQVCTALDYAHRQGVVHRDIKPENILIDAEGHAKIADFGLAKIMPGAGSSDAVTQTRVVMGTPRYMAPEQSENPKAVDHRSDIYALGVVLYEMLTGALPLGHFAPPSEKAPVDRRVDGIVFRALEAAPERRYQQVSELKTDLEDVSARPGGPGLAGAQRKFSMALLATLLVLASLFGLGGKLLRKAPSPEAPLAVRPVKVREWQWENPGPGTRLDGADIVLTPSDNKRLSEAIPVGSTLGKKFHLHFQFRYLLDPRQEPWLFLIMEASPASTHERNGLVIFPEAGHTIHFASRQAGQGWGMRDWDSLPPAAHGENQWFDVDVSWDDSSKRLKATFGGKLVFNQQLGPKDTLHGSWSFGLGGTTKEFRIRDTWVENVP